ncbi:hypothetical protein PflSS101_2042 [Pseudomonas lactis]|uniref:Uncharacterized protein n=1 Tax=Pseudomonas lactis TaxID=1615674 RepID=I4K2Y7_9PSED|nr:hypothetical protein PflSS101_2042 [Pseudomonas lactis]
MATRYAKRVLVAVLAAFAALAVFNNLTDYTSNSNFIRHVLSMDTTFPDNAAMSPAITVPWLWHGAYWLIIAGEVLSALVLAANVPMLWRARHRSDEQFNRAQACAVAASPRACWCGSSALW